MDQGIPISNRGQVDQGIPISNKGQAGSTSNISNMGQHTRWTKEYLSQTGGNTPGGTKQYLSQTGGNPTSGNKGMSVRLDLWNYTDITKFTKLYKDITKLNDYIECQFIEIHKDSIAYGKDIVVSIVL